MEIILFRHGKVDYPPLRWIPAAEFSNWVSAYDSNGLDESSRPSSAALKKASEAPAVVCSELKRSIDSAKILSDNSITLIHPVFNEADMPIAAWRFPHLSVPVWALLFRVMWLFGYSNNAESFKEAKQRGTAAASILIELARENQSVMLAGHGVINRIIARELLHNGWKGPKTPGGKNWAFSVYTNIQERKK